MQYSPARRAAAGLLMGFMAVMAQPAPKRTLTHQDYDSWRSIQGQQLSPDGKYLVYALLPQQADGEVVIRSLATGAEKREPVGLRPQPPARNPEGLLEERPPEAPGVRVLFSHDSRYAVFSTFPPKADVEKAKKDKKEPPKGGLIVFELASGKAVRIDRVKNFQVPDGGDGYFAWQREAPPAPEKKPAEESPRPRGARKEYGTDLVLHRLEDHSQRVFPDVTEYLIAKDAGALIYVVSSKTEENNGVYRVKPGAGEQVSTILAGKGKYAKLAHDESWREYAFVSDRDDPASKTPRNKLYGWRLGSASAVELASPDTPGVAPGLRISDRASLSFSNDSSRLFFGCSPVRPSRDDTRDQTADDDRPRFDLWHWKDDYIQPMQKVRAEIDRNRSWRAVVDLESKKVVQLGDRTLEEIAPSEDGRWAIGTDNREYRRGFEYDERYADHYLVDTSSGERKLIGQRQLGRPSWSPDGRYMLRFDGRSWRATSVADVKTVDLTSRLGVRFDNEEHDTPNAPNAYGLAGWTSDGRWVLLYDRYDLWQVAPDGSAAKNLTDGIGRKEHLQFRYVKLDPEEKSIDPRKPLLLRAENLDNFDTGFYRDSVDGEAAPRRIVMAAAALSAPQKAKRADVFLLLSSTFRDSELQVAVGDLAEMRKVSDSNPQKKDILLGNAELLKFRNADGVELKGVLYKPENFDPGRKYPLIVYIYERLSNTLHRYVDPRPSHSINPVYYTSNGYLVLEPDIVYKVGYPGQSALGCVLPAIEALVDRGYVDEKAIGIQGHSWGGYQIAYMITRTNRFRAVAAGAPVANMISAYDGIRWGPGMPRQFQYERTQSRIGGSLWQYPMRFIENSPVFMADRVQTPVLMLHNDADDAVPWYQGIEFYLALRRLGKEVYFFAYNGEPHGLRRRPNQKDYTMRLQQFFDHYLKGAPAPGWMQRGIPYLERDSATP